MTLKQQCRREPLRYFDPEQSFVMRLERLQKRNQSLVKEAAAIGRFVSANPQWLKYLTPTVRSGRVRRRGCGGTSVFFAVRFQRPPYGVSIELAGG